MDLIDRPSRAAIAVLDRPRLLVDWLDEAMRPARYRRYDASVPKWHSLRDDEWLGFVVTRSDDLQLSIAVPEHQGLVFQVAYWLSKARPAAQLVAYRYQRGLDSCLKYYAGGKPQYKLGEDEDHEVEWHVPRQPGIDIVTAAEAGLPGTRSAFEETVGTALLPYPQQVTHHGPEDVVLGYLHRDSPLWD